MRFISMNSVTERTGYSRVHLWRLIKTGKFPQPRKLSERKIGFLETDVDEWMQSRPVVNYAKGGAGE